MLPKFAPTMNSGPMGSRSSDDPLARAIAPPPDETPEERAQRVQAEEKARKVSEQIDKMLKRDGEKLNSKNKHVVKVLLLGQSESGKSTALKNFQLLYNPNSFHAERAAWRLVVLFNLVRLIRVLHQIVSDALRAQEAESQTLLSSASPMHYRTAAPDFQDLLPPLPTAATIRSKRSTGSFLASPETPTSSQAPRPIGATEQEQDLTDAASSHSAGTSSSKGIGSTVRRSSIFNLSSRDKKSSPAQSKRPATSQGLSPGIDTMNPGFGSTKGKTESSSRVPSDEVKTRASPWAPGSGAGSSKTAGLFNGDRSRNSSVIDTSSKRGNISPPTSPAVDNGEFDNPLFRSRSREGSQRSRSIVPGSVDYTSKTRSNESVLYPGDNKQTRSLPTRLGAPALTILLPADNLPKVTFTNQHRVLLMRLKPLLTVELNLLRRLSFPDEDEAVRLDFNTEGMRAAALTVARAENATIPGRPKSSSGRPRAGSSVDGQPSSHALATRAPGGSASSSSLDVSPQNASARINNDGLPEFTVRSPNWKERLNKWRKYDPSQKITNNSGEWNPWDDEDDPAHFIQACAADLKALWRDPIVQEYLDRCQIKLEHLPGFFLNDVDRIVTRDYVPTNDDILRARLKTMGVTEHAFTLDRHSSTMPKEWLIYDVGGSRTQRSAWQPYFDSANAIIFIVAISAFDETLAEDPSMNRMEDSLRLFRSIVSSPILKNVNLILFLNKMDLLEDKLNAGIQVSRYFKRYGDRPNTVESVTKYFRAKFAAIYDKYTPPESNRVFFSHTTSLTNPQATKAILSAVGESIIGATVQYTLS